MFMKKILVIEDDAVAAKIYLGCLQKAGYETDLAIDGQAGLERLVEFRPDGILLDLMLPKMSGINLLKSIRRTEFKAVPVLAFTNAFLPKVVEEALKAGANKVFDKSKLSPSIIVGEFEIALRDRK
jgi:CheY-like chemotaxis protein